MFLFFVLFACSGKCFSLFFERHNLFIRRIAFHLFFHSVYFLLKLYIFQETESLLLTFHFSRFRTVNYYFFERFIIQKSIFLLFINFHFNFPLKRSFKVFRVSLFLSFCSFNWKKITLHLYQQNGKFLCELCWNFINLLLISFPGIS